MTWPLAAVLIARQRGNATFKWLPLLRANGVRAAFRGCLPYASYKLFGIGTQRGVQAPVLVALDGAMGDFERFALAGVASGVLGGLAVTPVEQWKISAANRDFGSGHEMRAFFLGRGAAGIRALFAGARVTVARNVAYDSINAVMYNMALRSGVADRTSPVQMSALNAGAGVLTAVLDYPLDVLKTRTQSAAVAAARANERSPSAVAIAQSMVRNEGVASLFGGLRQKLVLYAAVWAVYGYGFALTGRIMSALAPDVHDG